MLNKKKLILYTLCVCIILMNVLAYFRWSYGALEGDFRYKTDRWMHQAWVEYYPPLAISDAIEFPLLNRSKFNDDAELEAYVHKYAVSGYIVDRWLARTKLTYIYMGVNLFLLFHIVLLLVLLRSRKVLRSRGGNRR
ncbi:hypothetical protein ABE504_23505 [Paenibacillus oryzisoli]|uniref:hypothetical protein n=1 Tax=Paenibacillus oryzisoli TaxID=1850517 RepID=UPI003D2E5E52